MKQTVTKTHVCLHMRGVDDDNNQTSHPRNRCLILRVLGLKSSFNWKALNFQIAPYVCVDRTHIRRKKRVLLLRLKFKFKVNKQNIEEWVENGQRRRLITKNIYGNKFYSQLILDRYYALKCCKITFCQSDWIYDGKLEKCSRSFIHEEIIFSHLPQLFVLKIIFRALNRRF